MESTRAFYAGELPPKTSALLDEAMSLYGDTERAESLLMQAHREDPDALPVYFSMYKFYFYKGRLQDAERAVRQALETAARLGGFSPDFRDLRPETTNWTHHDGPAHFYLFSLKALSFIRLRQGDKAECEELLGKLNELDKSDSVGGSVIGAFAAGV
ncbi:tetratricopeptide repeat protein [Methyloterricola oryzae]|uniref:tetratricopeptide repeat protein n=1 Tax=Methyloterricola oryzae TaxID=1495050 RepID=UPI0005EB2C80|nr:tetratricopeptide repeat protein [Methyloterricola oryzae]